MKTSIQSDKEPHFIKGDEDHNPYWTQLLVCSDTHIVIGNGLTSEQAQTDADNKRQERENWIKSPARDRIKQLVSKTTRCTMEQDDLNKAFAEALGIL